jgi:lysyl-tRNA synthetase class I
MVGFFDKQTLELPCPKCGKKTKKTVAWLKANSKFKCSCGADITVDSSKLHKDLGKVEQSIDKLTKSRVIKIGK